MSSKELSSQPAQYVGPYRLEKTLGKGQTGKNQHWCQPAELLCFELWSINVPSCEALMFLMLTVHGSLWTTVCIILV